MTKDTATIIKELEQSLRRIVQICETGGSNARARMQIYHIALAALEERK